MAAGPIAASPVVAATAPPAKPSRTRAAVVAILAAHALLSLWAISRNSVTVDECNHLPAGISYIQKRTFQVYHGNPPLAKVLCGMAALAAGARSNYDRAWRQAEEHQVPVNITPFGWDFQEANYSPPGKFQKIYFAARLVVLAISLAGGLLIFAWARDLAGDGAGLVALAVWSFSPTVLAHGGLVTTDVPAAVAGVGATYAFWRWARRPTWRGALAAGALLGVAQLVKFSLLVLLVIWPALGAISAAAIMRSLGHTRGRAVARLAAHGLAILATCLLAVNAGHLFEGTGRRLGDYEFLSVAFTKPRTEGEAPYSNLPHLHAIYKLRMNRFRGTLLEGLPVPLPAHYLLGLDAQMHETNTGIEGAAYPMYLRGELRRRGWWYYYPYALAIKIPLGTWLLFAAALAATVAGPRLWLGLRDEAFVWLPAAASLASMMSLTKIQIGVRYVLPAFPYVAVGIGRLAAARGRRPWRLILATGLGATALSALLTAPHFIAYFNMLAGGPSRGHRHLIDSNLDLGQDFLELKKMLDRRGHTGPLPCALFGNLDPIMVGIEAAFIPRDPRTVPAGERDPEEPDRLTPGLHAVSVNYVMGMPYRWAFHGRLVKAREFAYAYFQRLEPVARAGYSVWLYELSAADCARLNAELGLAPADAPP